MAATVEHQAGAKRTVRCPDNDNGIAGCGFVFTDRGDWENFYDCPNCGMWFDPDHPDSQPQP